MFGGLEKMLASTLVIVYFLFSGASSDFVRVPLKRTNALKRSLLRDIAARTAIATKTSAEVLNQYGVNEYYGEISVGTPPQNFTAYFLLSFSDVCIPSVHCHQACGKHKKYDSSKSKTYVANGKKVGYEFFYYSSFTSSEFDGFLSTDTVEVAGLKIANQTFGEITDVKNSSFSDESFDVFFGLGVNKTGITGVASPLYQMYEQKLIEFMLFSIYLSRDANSSQAGEIVFGGVDKKVVKGPIKFTPLSSDTHWIFTGDHIKMLKKTYAKNGFLARTEMSLPLIVGPRKIITRILKNLKTEHFIYGLHAVKCADIPKLPTIYFVISKNRYPLEPQYYVEEAKNGVDGMCIVKIFGVEYESEEIWLLGTPFLTKYSTVYDAENKRIGFAPLY